MSTHTVVLTDHEEEFIQAAIAGGKFAEPVDAIRAGLHLLEMQNTEADEKLVWLRDAVQRGLDSLQHGRAKSFSSIDDLGLYVKGMALAIDDAQSNTHV